MLTQRHRLFERVLRIGTVVYLLAAALLCGFAVLAFSGRGSPAPGAAQGIRVCTATQRRSVTCPRSALFVPADYVKNGSVNDSYCVGFADQADTPEASLDRSTTSAILRACVAKLSPAHREIINLVYYHEKSVEEAGAIIGIPQSTVKTRMFYARKQLADLLRGAGVDSLAA